MTRPSDLTIRSEAAALVSLDVAIAEHEAVVAYLHRARPGSEAHRMACEAVVSARKVRESVEGSGA